MSLVVRIKEKCKEKGTTMGSIEKELNMGNGTIRRWDERIPSVDKALLVAQRLEVSLDWLVLGKETEDLTPEEQELVDRYRTCDERGKRNIMITAKAETEYTKSFTCPTGKETGTDN